MKDTTYIIGHKNPDTDSVASAMAYEEFKRLQNEDVKAFRLGTLSEETKFATRYFDVEAPELIKDARAQLWDIDFDKPEIIDIKSSCNDALKRIMKTKTKTLFVTDRFKVLKGIISVGDLVMIKLNSKAKKRRLLKTTNLAILKKDLKAKVLLNSSELKLNGEIFAYDKDRQDTHLLKGSICILNDEIAAIKDLIALKPALIILTLGAVLEDEALKTAKKANVNIISSKYDVLKVASLLEETIPVRSIMTKEFVCYKENDFVDEVARKVANTRFRSYPILNDKGQIVGALSRYHLFKFRPKRFILVDHSSKIQSIDNIDKAEVVEIIDHHHIGDIETKRPIFYRNQKCGSTSTIIYQMYKENDFTPSLKIAGMMLSAIISDTLYFHLETTTELDRKCALDLAKIAKFDLEEYAGMLLEASVNLKNANAKELIFCDLKRYTLSAKKIAVSQTNYADLEDIQSRMGEFKEASQSEAKNKDYDLIIMMFTHVKGEGTMFMYYGPLSYVMNKVIATVFDKHSGYDKDIASRKQQLIPKLSDVLNEEFNTL